MIRVNTQKKNEKNCETELYQSVHTTRLEAQRAQDSFRIAVNLLQQSSSLALFSLTRIPACN